MQTHANDIKTRSTAAKTLRGGLAVTGTVGLTVLVSRATMTALAPLFAPGPSSFAELLVALIAVLALLLLLGQSISLVLGTLSQVPGLIGRAAYRLDAALTPAFMRRVTALTLGGVMTAGMLPGTAVADSGRTNVTVSVIAPDVSFGAANAARAPEVGFGIDTQGAAPDVAFVPDRPAVRPMASPEVLGSTTIGRPDGVVVHRGDSLWSIAARALGPNATEAQIAAEWPRWYAANRAVIGADPDLILPGTVLTAPTAANTATATTTTDSAPAQH